MNPRTCIRPTCPKAAAKGKRGYCLSHYLSIPDRGYIDSAECREHINLLRNAGYSLFTISDMTGLDRDTLTHLGTYTSLSRVEMNTHLSIMRIPLPNGLVDGGARIPNVGTKRRLKSLMAFGYSLPILADELGMTAMNNVSNLLRQSHVSSATAVKVKEVFDRLHMTPGPSRKAAQMAAKKGWVLPLAWDDEDIDNPDAEPQLPEDDKNAWFEDYQELKRLGKSDEEIAERMGLLLKSLKRRLLRYETANSY